MHSEVSEPQIYSMHLYLWLQAFPGGSVVKNPPANAEDTGDAGLIPRLGRSPGGGNGNLL